MTRRPPDQGVESSLPTSNSDGRERCLSLLGLAYRARQVVVGSESVMAAIRARRVSLVFLAHDAGDNAKKKYRDKCAFYHIPIAYPFDRRALGRAIGRSECAALAVTDPGFAARMVSCIGEFSGGDAFDETAGL